MLNRFLLSSALILGANSIFSSQPKQEMPRVIDFKKIPTKNSSEKDVGVDFWNLGYYAFNSAPEIGTLIAYLKRNFSIYTAIETGTCTGATTISLSLLFDTVHTIEIAQYYYDMARTTLVNCNNVTCHFGSSEKVLHKLLPSLKDKPILFYLDAHWESFWPLLDELEEISKTHRDNCIIVIDDFKVPDRKDIGYDAYGPHECSYEYIKDHLDKVYSAYTYHYVIPKNINSRAKFVAIPKKWR